MSSYMEQVVENMLNPNSEASQAFQAARALQELPWPRPTHFDKTFVGDHVGVYFHTKQGRAVTGGQYYEGIVSRKDANFLYVFFPDDQTTTAFSKDDVDVRTVQTHGGETHRLVRIYRE